MGFQTKTFDAQDALVGALQATPTLDLWTIDFGIPSRRDERHIWVDEQVEEWVQGQATSGLVSRSEDFRLNVYIYDRLTGATAKTLRDEIKGVADIISDVVGSAPFLGYTVLYAQIVGAEYDSAFADPEGRSREGVLKLTIGCQAYIT